MLSRNTSSLLGVLVAATLGLVLVAPAQAALFTWNGPNLTGTWDTTDTNWVPSTGGTPWDLTNGPTNTASFNTDNNVANVGGAIYANTVTVGALGNTVNVPAGASLDISNGGSLSVGGSNDALVVNGTLTMNANSGRNINLNAGSGNSIRVQGGGTVTLTVTSGAGTIYMGSTSSAAPNTLTVTGTGSTFTNGNASFGANIWFSGSNSQIIVSDGGVFTSLYRGIYVGGRWGANTNNSLSITGASQLTTNSTISLNSSQGDNSTNMTLTISGASVANSTGGNISSSTGTNNNTATITGSGSLWNLKNGNLQVGNNAGAQNNTLNVSNGGSLINVGSVLMNGTNNNFNLGNGSGISTATINSVTLGSAGANLNIFSGRLIAGATGSLVTGLGTISLNGAAYIDIPTGLTNTITVAISGIGSLTKEGAGTLDLTQINTYTGDTIVTAGILQMENAYLADAADVRFTGGMMNLNTTGASDTIDELYFGTVAQATGTWGSTASLATNKNDTYFSGTGMLNVMTPEPATLAFVALGGLGLLARRRRRA
jgi:autotransporter-associated beta strand protein